VLVHLRAVGRRGATTAELAHPSVGGVRFGGRVHELVDAGVEIEVRRERAGSFRYVLVSEPGTPAACDFEADAAAAAALFEPPPSPPADAIGGEWE
jgi:hypothetical protein